MTIEEIKQMKERLAKGPITGEGVYISPKATVLGEVYLGDNVSIWPSAVIRGDINTITIGKNSNVQDCSVLHVGYDEFTVVIGENTSIGHSVCLHGCKIGNNALIGNGAIVLDGAIIPDNSVVAAGSVVPPGKTYPEGYMIMGSPAKAVRPLREDEFEWVKLNAENYVDYKNVFMEMKI